MFDKLLESNFDWVLGLVVLWKEFVKESSVCLYLICKITGDKFAVEIKSCI